MELPESQRIYRYWVELRDRRDGSVRSLPLGAQTLIHLPTKKSELRRPDEQVLQLRDGTDVMEARDLEALKAQLREKYPDETYERFLRRERDVESERRKAEALDGLIEILVKAATDEVLCEEQQR